MPHTQASLKTLIFFKEERNIQIEFLKYAKIGFGRRCVKINQLPQVPKSHNFLKRLQYNGLINIFRKNVFPSHQALISTTFTKMHVGCVGIRVKFSELKKKIFMEEEEIYSDRGMQTVKLLRCHYVLSQGHLYIHAHCCCSQ